MKLKDYLEEYGLQKMVFAQRVGITLHTLNSAIAGSREISLSLAVRISEVSEGKVALIDLLNPAYLKKHEKRAKDLKERKNRLKEPKRDKA